MKKHVLFLLLIFGLGTAVRASDDAFLKVRYLVVESVRRGSHNVEFSGETKMCYVKLSKVLAGPGSSRDSLYGAYKHHGHWRRIFLSPRNSAAKAVHWSVDDQRTTIDVWHRDSESLRTLTYLPNGSLTISERTRPLYTAYDVGEPLSRDDIRAMSELTEAVIEDAPYRATVITG